jgi:sec-independent protein translocase protein TatA
MVGIGMPGMSEWIVILVIVLIFFGAGKLPEVFSQAGKGLKAFKDASEGKDGKKADEPTDEVPAKKSRAARQIAQDELDDEDEAAAVKQSAKPQKD